MAKGRAKLTVRTGPSSSERPGSPSGEPMRKLPAGMTTISGQISQSRKLSPSFGPAFGPIGTGGDGPSTARPPGASRQWTPLLRRKILRLKAGTASPKRVARITMPTTASPASSGPPEFPSSTPPEKRILRFFQLITLPGKGAQLPMSAGIPRASTGVRSRRLLPPPAAIARGWRPDGTPESSRNTANPSGSPPSSWTTDAGTGL